MAEMTHTGEHHGNIVLIGSGNDFLVAHGTAGLYDGGDACFIRSIDAIAEREEGI